jgi:hypothetical protein
MAKSKNAKLNDTTVDLTDVDLGSATPNLDFLRANAEPKTQAPTPAAPKAATEASDLAKSLPVEDLGVAYEKTQTKELKKRPPRVTKERPIVNLNKKVIEGLPPSEVERLNEEPTNVPHTFSNGEYRNQLHGDYSHFAKATNLLSYLGEKVGAAQDALANHPEHRDALDKINQMLSIAHGHVTDATTAHREGESGMVRLHPVTGQASPIGKQFLPKFLKDGREDVAGAQAIEREMRVSDSSYINPVKEINTRFGEPQLRSEGLKTQDLNLSPNGAIPHFHRALEYATTASNLLQNTLAAASSDRELSTSIRPWNGKYDERPGNPDVVNHARELSDNYANSVAEAKPAPEMTEDQGPSAEERDLFDNKKKARESELNAKVHQAEIHVGLVMKAHRETFGADILARREEAARKTEELKAIPVITRAGSGPGLFSDLPVEEAIAKKQNISDTDYAKLVSKSYLERLPGKNGLDGLHQIAKDAHAAGKIDNATLQEINGHVEAFKTHHTNALAQAASEPTLPEEPASVYDKSKDPRFMLSNIEQERLSPAEKAQKRNEFLKNRGITLVQHQREVRAFEDKLPVIRATDADNRANYLKELNAATLGHHDEISRHAKAAIDSINRVHSILEGAGVIQSTEPGQVKPDYTGIPSPEQFFRASTPERMATREDAMAVLQRDTEAAQLEASKKAQEEAAKKAALSPTGERERSYTREAGELGFITADENLARGFIEAGEKNAVTPGMAEAKNPGVGGARRVEFLSALNARGAIDYSATPKPVTPGKALFIAPGMAEATPAPVSPTERKRRARAEARLTSRADASARRRLGQQVNTLGLNLEDVTVPEPRPSRAARVASETEAGKEFSAENAGVDPKLFDKLDENAFQIAKKNLEGIQEFNATNAAETVGTTIKPTRRTRK